MLTSREGFTLRTREAKRSELFQSRVYFDFTTSRCFTSLTRFVPSAVASSRAERVTGVGSLDYVEFWEYLPDSLFPSVKNRLGAYF